MAVCRNSKVNITAKGWVNSAAIVAGNHSAIKLLSSGKCISFKGLSQ